MEKSKLIVIVSLVVIAIIAVIFFISWIANIALQHQQDLDEIEKIKQDRELLLCEEMNPQNKISCTLEWAKQRIQSSK